MGKKKKYIEMFGSFMEPLIADVPLVCFSVCSFCYWIGFYCNVCFLARSFRAYGSVVCSHNNTDHGSRVTRFYSLRASHLPFLPTVLYPLNEISVVTFHVSGHAIFVVASPPNSMK